MHRLAKYMSTIVHLWARAVAAVPCPLLCGSVTSLAASCPSSSNWPASKTGRSEKQTIVVCIAVSRKHQTLSRLIDEGGSGGNACSGRSVTLARVERASVARRRGAAQVMGLRRRLRHGCRSCRADRQMQNPMLTTGHSVHRHLTRLQRARLLYVSFPVNLMVWPAGNGLLKAAFFFARDLCAQTSKAICQMKILCAKFCVCGFLYHQFLRIFA